MFDFKSAVTLSDGTECPWRRQRNVYTGCDVLGCPGIILHENSGFIRFYMEAERAPPYSLDRVHVGYQYGPSGMITE